LDGDHRCADAGRSVPDGHHETDASILDDVLVAAVLEVAVAAARAERDVLAAADPERMLENLGGPAGVARHVPTRERRRVLPGGERARDGCGVRAMYDDCVMAGRDGLGHGRCLPPFGFVAFGVVAFAWVVFEVAVR